MDQVKKDKIVKRSKGVCELCGGELNVIYSLLRKGQPQDEDPIYSMLGLCNKCAHTLKSGKTVKTSKSVKLVIFSNHTIRAVDGNISNKAIKEQVKGNYEIVGPFLTTDIISKQKISYILSKR